MFAKVLGQWKGGASTAVAETNENEKEDIDRRDNEADDHGDHDDTAILNTTEEDLGTDSNDWFAIPDIHPSSPKYSKQHFVDLRRKGHTINTSALPTASDDTSADATSYVYASCTERTRLNGFYCKEYLETFWIRFMGLPREIREIMYGDMFAKLPSSIVLAPFYSRTPLSFLAILPPICYLNKQVFNESILTLLRSKYIRFRGCTGSAVLITLLDRVPRNDAYKVLAHLGVEGGQAIREQLQEESGLMRILTLGTGPRSLQIQLNAFDFLNRKSLRWQKKSRNDVLDRFRGLALVFGLSRLSVLAIHCRGGRAYMDDVGCSEEAIFEHLVSWIKGEISGHGAKLDLRVTYSDPNWTQPRLYNIARYPYSSDEYMGWSWGQDERIV